MNKRYGQEVEYHNIHELLRYIDDNTPTNKEAIQKVYKKLFGQHMPKRVTNKVLQILERGA